MEESLGHQPTLRCHVFKTYFPSMEEVCQINKQYTLHILSQGGESTTYTRNMLKVLKGMEISSNMHNLHGYGKKIQQSTHS